MKQAAAAFNYRPFWAGIALDDPELLLYFLDTAQLSSLAVMFGHDSEQAGEPTAYFVASCLPIIEEA
ncbi:MAG: hypothetical protein ACR2QF_07115 [Geminicoccaceae bacterium]